jgi:indole-3-glycerol phosphate synthase
VAECKAASPSAGQIATSFDPAALAQRYAENGAAAISVLTDEKHFHGTDDHLRAVRRAVHLPLLRKEFIIDPWQVAESRSLGADCILLIVAVLEDAELGDLLALADRHGMDALVEVHTNAELDRALATEARMIGVNNRDLHTFTTSLATSERLIPRARSARREALLVCESGIRTRDDVARARDAGADAILVGETLVRAGDTAGMVRLLASPAGESPDA